MEHKGFFITFESTAEGVGKTTQARHLYERLACEGYDVVLTRETGGTPIGQRLRELYLDPAHDLSLASELFIIMADRAQHYHEVLRPALQAGKIVVCDRFLDSTLVYQGCARGWNTDFLLQLHQAAADALTPDLTIVLDGEPFRKTPNHDRFEQLGSSFFTKVKRGMLDLAKKEKRYVLLETQMIDEIEMAGRIFDVAHERIASAGLPNPRCS